MTGTTGTYAAVSTYVALYDGSNTTILPQSYQQAVLQANTTADLSSTFLTQINSGITVIVGSYMSIFATGASASGSIYLSTDVSAYTPNMTSWTNVPSVLNITRIV